jgi:hypothetical protein
VGEAVRRPAARVDEDRVDPQARAKAGAGQAVGEATSAGEKKA